MRKHHYRYLRDRYLTDPRCARRARRSAPPPRDRPGPNLGPVGPGRSRLVHPPGSVPDVLRRRQGHHPAVQGPPRRPPARQDHRRTPDPPPRTRRAPPLPRRRRDRLRHQVRPRRRAQPPTTAAASSSTPNGSPPPAAKPPPPWTASPDSPRSPPAPKASSTTPPCAASTTRRCSETSACCPSTGSPPPKPPPRPPAAKADAAVEKSVHLEDKTITLPDGTQRTLQLYAHGGALGIGELTDTGDLTFTELARTRTHRNADRNGRYRWYNDYRLPERHGGGTLTVRLHGNDDRPGPQTQPHREPPTHPGDGPRLRPALPETQRRRDHQPRPRRHALPPSSPQRRPRPPTPQPARLRPRRQRRRPPPPPARPSPRPARCLTRPAATSLAAGFNASRQPPTRRLRPAGSAARPARSGPTPNYAWPPQWRQEVSRHLFAIARPRSSVDRAWVS